MKSRNRVVELVDSLEDDRVKAYYFGGKKNVGLEVNFLFRLCLLASILCLFECL